MIHLVVALQAEAGPLIAHYGLERVPDTASFPVYSGSDVHLVVSGVGKEAAAGATSYLHHHVGEPRIGLWLNVGIAGHRSHPVGHAVLADRVLDQSSGRAWEPTPPVDSPCESGTVCTVDDVEARFADAALYDMEAAGFYATAVHLAPPELVQVLKIVSDNRRTGTLCVSARQVQNLVEENLSRIDHLVSSLHRRARHLSR